MSSNDTSRTLIHPEDWEPWIKQTRAIADSDIWAYIDPDTEEPDGGLLEQPERPEIQDFSENANTYAQLTVTQQKAYDNSRKYYDQDMKYYFRQQDLLRSIRKHISDTVSPTKRLQLDADLSVRDWLVKLKEDTAPTQGFMLKKVHQTYVESLKGLKPSKINQWLDNWEHAIKMAEKYQIPQVSNGMWLQDLAESIRPLSETYFVLYNKQSNDPEKSKLTEYRKVALELREAFAKTSNKAVSTGTARGSAFQADFNGESEDDSNATEGPMGKGHSSLSNSRKRAGPDISVGETSPNKRPKVPICLACDMRGHTLPDCWYLFNHKRPKGFKVAKKRMEKVNKRLETDKDLCAQVEKLKLENDEA
jgi:hypothetical protein